MIETETLKSCALCGGSEISSPFQTKDFMVTEETFSVSSCNSCGFHFTNPRPLESLVAKYYASEKYLSHSSKRLSLVESLYGLAKKFTLNWKTNLITQFVMQKNKIALLDVGCGNGDFLQHCKTKSMQVMGVESADEVRKSVKDKTGLEIFANINHIHDRKFDVITFWHVLEHLFDLDLVMNKTKSLLNDGGLIFVALPNRNSYDASKYQTYWAAWDVPRHLWHFSQSDMKRFCANNNLQIKHIVPMKLDAYYVSMLSERYKRGKQNAISLFWGFIRGLMSNMRAGEKNEYSSLIYVISK
jgi:2-polyprenyl-3-methyl-5-hydroxy-6-metoxy-1,4-benzoquinol methylase